jgi:hypothetical protein
MKDGELVLRFIALKDNWRDYKGNMKRVLDYAILEKQNANTEALTEYQISFMNTLAIVKAIFGLDGAFRRWLPGNQKWKNKVSAPLFDAQMFACINKDLERADRFKDLIIADYQRLFTEDALFIESIDRSTGTPKNFNYRVFRVEEIIDKYLS